MFLCLDGVGQGMSFRTRIEQHQDRLTVADQRLVRELLANPTEGAFLSTAGLADRASVHPATVVRLAQKLGFGGYPELRAELQAEIIKTKEPAERVRRRLAHLEDGSILAALVESEINTLRQLGEQVSEAQIQAAARTLIAARQVFLFARGNAMMLVELMGRRLRRTGFKAIFLTHQGRELAERVLTLGQEDVVLAFAFHSVPRGLVPLLEHATAVGATSILISDVIGPLVAPKPDMILAANRGLEDEFLTLTVPMAICNALILAIARLDEGRSLQALDRLGQLIRQFRKAR